MEKGDDWDQLWQSDCVVVIEHGNYSKDIESINMILKEIFSLYLDKYIWLLPLYSMNCLSKLEGIMFVCL